LSKEVERMLSLSKRALLVRGFGGIRYNPPSSKTKHLISSSYARAK
jgi:hypothetical protein